ncbi:unnamed protein product [Mytilus coruscus]|uniref:CARD domain-containing protein n=1 Tax=Mytilus coruscus TaxID=42192 RepID=A0A6J8BCE7_MYTCO|nr:unnamed protein product [Mytilus coruscus]
MATKEEDNFLRVVYLNYRVGTTALRRYFDCIHPNLPSDLSSPINKAILLGLHKPPRGQRKVLYQEQWNVLYPSSGSPAVSSANLDVTLMVCLLRNVPPKVSQPPNGFDVLPQSGDLSPGAHIARIKYYKNYLVSHSKDGKLSDADFNIIWIDLEMAINGLGSQQDATDAVDAKSKVLDYKALNELVNFGGGIQRNLKRLNDHSNELAVHTSKIRKLETIVENMEKEAQSVKKDVDVRSSKGTFNKLKDELLRSSILDREVLDNLISKCVLLLDDKEEIDSFPDQLSRNQKLLEILMHRPYNTFNMFVEAVKESDQQCHTSLVVNMESRFSDKISKVPHKKDIADVEKQTVKLIKWFKTLSHEIDTDIAGILDKLSAKGVISYEENSKIRLANITPQEKFRGLLENIIRKNVSSASTIFIKVLQEECCYQEYATKIEETDVTQFDLELLYIGRITRERKKKKKERKTRKRNGMTDLMIDKIETWDKDDSRYIHTRATDHVLTCINKHKCVSVTGPSGSGKTAMVRHVALQMETNGYTILPVRDGKEMIEHYKSDRKTLYIVDDMCGHFTANQKRIEKWKKLINDVQSILENSKYKLILTCRLQVFQDKGFENLVIFKACECNLRSRNLSLTSDEKKKMTMAYFKEHSSEALKHLGEYEFLPLLCKLYYVEKTNPQFTLEIFLNDPFSFYVKELTHMYNDCKEGKYKYCALLLLVIFNNKLEEKHLTGKDPKLKEHIEDIIEVCEISENITGRKLRTELEILTGTFVTNDEGIYQTIHDKLFDFLAFYFGTQEQLLTLLINNANGRFLRERFVVANKTESANYSIPIPDDKLKMYMKRIFDDMVTSSSVYINITENRNFMNVEFSNMFLDYMKHLTQPEKSELIKIANSNFFTRIFVLKEEDINHNCYGESECFGIVIPADSLQQYIEQLFDHLTKSDSVSSFIRGNRPLQNVSFCTAFRSYIKQLNTEQIAFRIKTGHASFLNEMFVMTDDVIDNNSRHRHECFAIVIPDDLLQEYIERWFYHLTQSAWPIMFVDRNRPLMSIRYRTALHSYMKHLKTETIFSFIEYGEADFMNIMFVMREDDIKENAENRYESFGFVIPGGMLQRYIEKWFDHLINTCDPDKFMDKNRPLMNDSFCIAFRSYIGQLKIETIANLIKTTTDGFLNTMFVMTDDDIKTIAKRRYECFGIVLPENLLNQYINRWFYHLTKSSHPIGWMNRNRLLVSGTFRTALRSYMTQLKTETIASLIQIGNADFLNTLFVMRNDDFKDNAKNRFESVGIVIPDDLLQKYIERWFDHLAKQILPIHFMDWNRQLMNLTFRTALRSYTKLLNTKTIASLIQVGNARFVNTMFVMTDDDIKDNAENRVDCVGIVIPDDLLHQYIERWFDHLAKQIFPAEFMETNRSFMNVTFRTALRSYTKQLNTETIASLIQIGNAEFLNTMFVMTKDDIKGNAENRVDCVGIVLPDNMFQQYIERWFDGMIQSVSIDKYIDVSRCLNDVSFQKSLRTYIKQLSREKIDKIIQRGNSNFLNMMFVMTEEDIKDNAENRYECFGIVIPNDLLQQYIERWFDDLADIRWNHWTSGSMERFINKNRVLVNVRGRTAIKNVIRNIHEEKIEKLIQKGRSHF